MGRAIPKGCVLLALGLAGGTAQMPALSAQVQPEAPHRWEYRVLTKAKLLELGQNDLGAGLNQLGEEGWELVTIDRGDSYFFKRPKDQIQKRVQDVKDQITLIETDIDSLKERVAWAERMAKKGFMTDQQVQAERTRLTRAEMALERARRDLKALPASPTAPAEQDRKPEP
jgi:hypothetical protein